VIISFGWTTDALLAGEKTVTRREWKHQHAARFKAGAVVDAWNTTPRNLRGEPRKVAEVRLTRTPYLESTLDMPEDDYAAEGFDYLDANGLLIAGMNAREFWNRWKLTPVTLWVVRFEVVRYLEGPLAAP